MKRLKSLYYSFAFKLNLVLVLCLFTGFLAVHKYYVSISQIEYIKDQNALQITSRIFIDDLENLFKERYDEAILLDEEQESELVEFYIERYLIENLKIKINGNESAIKYLGKEYENDIVFCYLEIEDITAINSIEITNKALFDKFDDQKNIVRLKIYQKTTTFVLTQDNQIGFLNFD